MGPRGALVVQDKQPKASSSGSLLFTIYLFDTLFAIGCGEPVPERVWTDSVHGSSPPSLCFTSPKCALPEGSRAAKASVVVAGVKIGKWICQ